MPELTLEALAARVASLEQKVATLAGVVPATLAWRSVVGISEETDFSRQLRVEIEAIREADRIAAREGTGE